MSLLGFVTGAASLFGGGGKGSTTSEASSTSSTQEQASQASENKTGTSNQQSSSSGTSNTSGSTAQQGSTSGQESSNTKGTTTNYSSDVLASLDAILGQQLGNGMPGTGSVGKASDAVTQRLQQIRDLAAKPAFDVAGYASGITQAATVAAQGDLDSRINGILSASGGSEGGNSMAALLGNKMRNETAANLAGISANATAQGNQILQAEQANLTSQISGLSGDLSNQVAALLGAAKGGTQSTTGAATSISNQTNQQTGTQQQSTTEQLQQNVAQQENVKTNQQGATTTTGQQDTNIKGSTKPNSNLFDRVLDAFSKSSAAA